MVSYLEIFAMGIILIAFYLYYQTLRIAIKPSETVTKSKKKKVKFKKKVEEKKPKKKEEPAPSFIDDLKETIKTMFGMREE